MKIINIIRIVKIKKKSLYIFITINENIENLNGNSLNTIPTMKLSSRNSTIFLENCISTNKNYLKE